MIKVFLVYPDVRKLFKHHTDAQTGTEPKA